MVTPIKGRRAFLGALLATGLLPAPTWADAGSPAFLSAAVRPDGSFVLCGIKADLQIGFQIPLPARGHAAAAHPTRPEAVAFARRPGTFALVLDCVSGVQKAMLTAPTGRHFYGHGAFSSDGSLLYTTENDFENGRGKIGVWDTRHGYARIDEWDSCGVGSHDIKRLPGSETLVIANGGIDTHPDTGRTKLNIPTMAPNLAYIEHGTFIATASLPAEMHKNSIRHLSVRGDGAVAFGMQWQGDGVVLALVGTHTIGEQIALMELAPDEARGMDGYVGSIAFSADGSKIAATSPRGGLLQLYDTRSRCLIQASPINDVSGVAMMNRDFITSSGSGELALTGSPNGFSFTHANLAWDNHLIPV